MGDYGIVEYFYEHSGHKCGYCKSESSSFSCGMWAHRLTAEIYDNLINRGWRRSGEYCYKPMMQKTCCRQYAIKLDVQNFKISKSQKKILKRMHKFLATGKGGDNLKVDGGKNNYYESAGDSIMEMPDFSHKKSDVQIDIPSLKEATGPPIAWAHIVMGTDGSRCLQAEIDYAESHSCNMDLYCSLTSPGLGPDPNKPKCRKAREIRRERKLQKLMESGKDPNSLSGKSVLCTKAPRNEPKTLEDFLFEPLPDTAAHKLEVHLVQNSPDCPQFADSFDSAFATYCSYQRGIHKDPPEKLTERRFRRFLVNSPLQVQTISSCSKSPEFDATFRQSWKVFEKYQMGIHKDSESECDGSSFRRFLVNSPLQHEPKGAYSLGSFHQQYWLDGDLIAVGVIDILPTCVSSVYLFYNPDYSFLSLGTYASLREIAFTRELRKTCPKISDYCMGFYIHTCPKMKYKGNFSPSYLLCPETYTWHPIEKCRPLLDINKYSRFEQDKSEEDKDAVTNLNEVSILFKRGVIPYRQYRQLKGNSDKEEVEEYASLVGKKCVKSLYLYRSS
ncbi:unnamed protein product [Ixodes hexagonus]